MWIAVRGVDLDAGILHVRQARKRERKEQGREVLTFGPPKTKKSQRSLRMPAPVLEAIQSHKIRQARARLAVGPASWEDNDLVFCSRSGRPSARRTCAGRSSG